MTRKYKTGLEFLQEEPHTRRGQQIQEESFNRVSAKMMPLQIGMRPEGQVHIIGAELIESMAQLCLEMYLRGRNEGVTAALLQEGRHRTLAELLEK